MKRKLWPIAAILLFGVVATIFILWKSPTPEGGEELGEEEQGQLGLEGSIGQSFDMSDEVIKTFEIELKTAGIAKLVVGSVYPGEVTYDQDRIAHVSSRLRGTVRESRVHLGDKVRKGQMLAVLDVPELADVRRRYDSAKSRSRLAKSAMDREERLWKRRISPERQYLEARQAYEETLIDLSSARSELIGLGLTEADFAAPSLSYYPLRSPISGIVAEKHAVVGEVIEPERDASEQNMFVIADLSTIWIEMAIPASDVRRARAGQEVIVTSKDLGESLTGRIAHVAPAIDEQRRSLEAHAEVANPGLRWKPGLFVEVRLAQENVEVPVAIRPAGLQMIEDRAVVFVRKGDAFEVRAVEVGRKSDDWVEIVSGLAAGEKYAADNSYMVKAEIGKGGAVACADE
jgi:membrane fusion protein, heavy metal efflux system